MPGDIVTLLMQADAPWWAPLFGVLIGVAIGVLCSRLFSSGQRTSGVPRSRKRRAQELSVDEMAKTREICSSLYNDLQTYSRQAMLLRADATLGRRSDVEVALDLTESQASVMETYATARLYAPGPVSDATARIVKVVGDCPILEGDDQFDEWASECKRMSTFLLLVGETRLKELAGKDVAKTWYEHLVATHPTRAEQLGPRRMVTTNGRHSAKPAKAS